MKILTHRSLSDETFENQFKELRLDPTLFTHEAHLRLAWLYIGKYGVNRAIESCSEQIRAFAEFHGDPDKYHQTVTLAAIKAVNHFMELSDSSNFEDFIKENSQLLTKFKELIGSHYSLDIFGSEVARKNYVPPDLQPF